MEQKMAKVTVNGETKEYPCGTSYRDIVDEYQKDTGFPIILVTADGRLRELHKKVKRDCTVEICDDQRSYRIFHLQKKCLPGAPQGDL